MARLVIIFNICLIIILNNCVKDKINFYEKGILEGEFIYERGNCFTLNLPYEINDNVQYVFGYNTPWAIDIIDIFVDGKRIPASTDLNLRMVPYDPSIRYSINKVTENQKEYYITMYWLRIGTTEMFWEDWTSGIDSKNFFSIHSRAYLIPIKGKELNIKYRIILPYPSLTPENLFDKNYELKEFTKEYNLYIDLKAFKSGPFKIYIQ